MDPPGAGRTTSVGSKLPFLIGDDDFSSGRGGGAGWGDWNFGDSCCVSVNRSRTSPIGSTSVQTVQKSLTKVALQIESYLLTIIHKVNQWEYLFPYFFLTQLSIPFPCMDGIHGHGFSFAWVGDLGQSKTAPRSLSLHLSHGS